MLNSKLQKLNRLLQTTISIWVTMAFLFSAFSPVAAGGITDRFSVPSANTDRFEESIKDLAERPLISTPLRLRNLAVESLRPVTSEQAGQNTLALAMVNRITEDNAAYFFDEGRITHSIVIAHDRELVQQLVRLLKDKRVSAEKKQVYLSGLLNILLADRHIAELAVQDARVILAGARLADNVKQSGVNRAEAHLNAAELRLRNGLDALRRGDADSSAQHFEKAWEFSANVLGIWNLAYDNDFDQDGVVDVVEMRIGSSPFAEDTDDDGLLDVYELNFLIPHTLPNSADTDNNGIADGNEDLDNDGVNNLLEQQKGTDALLKDTDGDSLTDGEEIQTGVTVPTSADTDADGLTDDSELRLDTAPNTSDTDGDGILDNEETHFQVVHDPAFGLILEIMGIGDHSKTFRAHSLANAGGFNDVPGLIGEFIDPSTDLPISSATVHLKYDPALVPNGDFGSLRLFQYNVQNALLEILPNQHIDTSANQINADSDNLGPVGIIYLPSWEEAQNSASLSSALTTNKGIVPAEEEVPTTDPTEEPIEILPEPTPQPTEIPGENGESIQLFSTLIASPTPADPDCSDGQCVFWVSAGSNPGNNDAGQHFNCTYSASFNEIYMGQCTNGQPITSGFRFPNVNIPPGSVIQEAHIEFTVDGPYSDGLNVAFYGEASLNSLPFSTTSRPSNRPLISPESVPWHIPSTEPWVLGEIRNSPDLSPILQKIVDQENWAEGNALAVILKNVGPSSGLNKHRRVIAFNRPVWYPGTENAARLVIVLGNGDSDQDGLTDQQERAGFRTQFGYFIFTDPLKADTDADGIPDGEEIIISDTTVRILADPTLADTDSDGVEDFVELYDLEAPLETFDPDSDNDGLLDGEEVNEYATNPLERDTDGDGVEDGREVRENADPLLATERMDTLLAAHEFAVGALCGEFCLNNPKHGNLAFFTGFLVSGLISVIPSPVTTVIGLIADLRDFFASIVNGDWAGIGLNALSLLPWLGDAVDVPATITKFLLKHADLLGEITALIARLDWLPDGIRSASLIAAIGQDVFTSLGNKGLDAVNLQRLGKAGVNLKRLNQALEPLIQSYPGLPQFLRILPAGDISNASGILKVASDQIGGLTVNLKGLAAATNPKSIASYLGNIKGAYTEWLVSGERTAQGWRTVQKAAHINAAGYDLVLEQGSIYRLVEAKARTSLSLSNFKQYISKNPITGELRFNERYFLRNLKQANQVQLLRSGNFEIEFYLNGPDSARLAQELLAQMGGTIAKYTDDLGIDHEIHIILTAVSQ